MFLIWGQHGIWTDTEAEVKFATISHGSKVMARRRAKPRTLKQRVGERVRYEREARRLTQAELARQSSVSVTHVSAVESGRRGITLETADKLAGGLGLPLAELLGERGEREETAEAAALIRIADSIRRVSPGQKQSILQILDGVEQIIAALPADN